MLDREERGGTAGRDADLRLDVLRVVICGLGGDHEPVGDLPGGEAGCQQPEHLGITGGQPGRDRGAGRRDGDLLRSAPALGQDPLYRLPVEAAGSAHRPQLDGSILGCVRGRDTGDPTRHGLKAVRGGDDPLHLVQVRAGDPSVVAGPVEALMRRERRPGRRRRVRHPPQELVGGRSSRAT